MSQQPTFAESDKPKDPPQWLFGREGLPASPGVTFGPPPAHPPHTARQEWFKDLKFGMFIHWGLDSVLAAHPGATTEAYHDINWDASSVAGELAKMGEAFDAKAWVDLAERSGQRYIAFTTKHHIGFANFASRLSDYNSAVMGPKRDFVRLLADECHRRGMPLIAYLSLPDLKHPDCRPLDKAAWDRYVEFLMGQIEELATNYGPIMAFWLDPGPWNGPSYHYPVARIQEEVHRRWTETLCFDWDESEQSYASRAYLNPEGMVMAYEIYPEATGPQPDAWPFEVCDTLNTTWFYNPDDKNYKDAPTLIRRLVEIVGRGGNYLLNMGPPPSGAVNPDDSQRFEAMGEWLRRNGEAVYGTRPLGVPAQPWGWPVSKDGRIYLHILNWPGQRLTLPGVKSRVTAARWLNGGELRFETGADGVTLHLPAAAPDPVDSIAVLELAVEPHAPAPVKDEARRIGGAGVPGLLKTGAVYADVCEGTPIVWQGRLLLLLNYRLGEAEGKPARAHYLELRDAADNRLLSHFADGYSLASAFVWDGVLHVYAARLESGGWHDVSEFQTRDLTHWSKPRVVIKENPDEQLFNQSVCRAGDRFVMAYESNDPRWPTFTIKFAESADLVNWKTMPDRIFGTDRYTACPWLTYLDGYYYMLYLEHIEPKWWFETYLTRSKDLITWEPSPRNPIVAPGPGEDCNTSDPDVTEFGGRVLLYYSYGDQRTWSKLTRAELPGTLRDFFAACYQTPDAERIALAYYYIWFKPDRWPTKPGQGNAALEDVHPILGAYDSANPDIIKAHIEMAQRAKLDAFAVSWFHLPDWTAKLDQVIEIASQRNFKICIDLEGDGKTLDAIYDALLYYLTAHRDDPRVLRKEGVPVVLIWGTWQYTPQQWRALFDRLEAHGARGYFLPSNQMDPAYLTALRGLEIYTLVDTDDVLALYRRMATDVQAFNQTDEGERRPAIFCGTLMPGFDERKIPGREYGPGGAGWREREGGEYYRRTFEAALAAGADWLHVTSFNELDEHSHIEPTKELGDFYIDLTAQFVERFKGAARGKPEQR